MRKLTCALTMLIAIVLLLSTGYASDVQEPKETFVGKGESVSGYKSILVREYFRRRGGKVQFTDYNKNQVAALMFFEMLANEVQRSDTADIEEVLRAMKSGIVKITAFHTERVYCLIFVPGRSGNAIVATGRPSSESVSVMRFPYAAKPGDQMIFISMEIIRALRDGLVPGKTTIIDVSYFMQEFLELFNNT